MLRDAGVREEDGGGRGRGGEVGYCGGGGRRLDELRVLGEGGEYLLAHALELDGTLQCEGYHQDFWFGRLGGV